MLEWERLALERASRRKRSLRLEVLGPPPVWIVLMATVRWRIGIKGAVNDTHGAAANLAQNLVASKLTKHKPSPSLYVQLITAMCRGVLSSYQTVLNRFGETRKPTNRSLAVTALLRIRARTEPRRLRTSYQTGGKLFAEDPAEALGVARLFAIEDREKACRRPGLLRAACARGARSVYGRSRVGSPV